MSSSSPTKVKVYKSEVYERLVACIGLSATRKLIASFGGKTLRIPLKHVFMKDTRNIMITQDYNSGKFSKKDLEAKYGFSYPTILKIVKETREDPRYPSWLQ